MTVDVTWYVAPSNIQQINNLVSHCQYSLYPGKSFGTPNIPTMLQVHVRMKLLSQNSHPVYIFLIRKTRIYLMIDIIL